MKANILASLFFATLTLAACDESTDQIGISLVDNADLLEVTTDSFNVSSKSVLADAVLGKIGIGYLGRIKDPETKDLISSSFMSQVATIENYSFPQKTLIANTVNGEVQADSCVVSLYFSEIGRASCR